MTRNVKKTVIALGLKVAETEYIKNLNMVRNKYYVGFLIPMDSGTHFNNIRKLIEEKKKRIYQDLKNNDLESYIFRHERPFRLEAFLDGVALMDLSDREIGLALASVWIDSENPSANLITWKALFWEYGKYSMDEINKESYDKLPEEVQVYRGGVDISDSDISWTTSIETAEWFAKRFNRNGKVLSKTVKKSEIVAYFDDRGESEVIIIKSKK